MNNLLVHKDFCWFVLGFYFTPSPNSVITLSGQLQHFQPPGSKKGFILSPQYQQFPPLSQNLIFLELLIQVTLTLYLFLNPDI